MILRHGMIIIGLVVPIWDIWYLMEAVIRMPLGTYALILKLKQRLPLFGKLSRLLSVSIR